MGERVCLLCADNNGLIAMNYAKENTHNKTSEIIYVTAFYSTCSLIL